VRSHGTTTFRALVADAGETAVVVARFLALLELFRQALVAFDQVTPLGELTVRWTGSEEGEVVIEDEFDGDPEEPAPDEPGDDPGDQPGGDAAQDQEDERDQT
jgi:segregation and condensation protein A